MAKTQDLRNRIKSVSSTMKITRTMEMVATVRSKKVQERLKGAIPFAAQLAEMAGRLVGSGAALHPLFRESGGTGKTVVLVITSDRGLCGGYNTHAIASGKAEVNRLRQAGTDVELHVVGKKGIANLNFLGWTLDRTYVDLDDRVTFSDIEPLASEFMSRFLAGEIDEVRVVCYRYLSASQQKPDVYPLLPVSPPEAEDGDTGVERKFDFLPSPAEILERLVPFEVKTALYTLFLEAGASEQIARRVAMKLATDNAEEMMKNLKQMYNRARQTQITTELLDIMGGAGAIQK